VHGVRGALQWVKADGVNVGVAVSGDAELGPTLVWGVLGETLKDYIPRGGGLKKLLRRESGCLLGILVGQLIASVSSVGFYPLYSLLFLMEGGAGQG
jgi:hypothetical protein